MSAVMMIVVIINIVRRYVDVMTETTDRPTGRSFVPSLRVARSLAFQPACLPACLPACRIFAAASLPTGRAAGNSDRCTD